MPLGEKREIERPYTQHPLFNFASQLIHRLTGMTISSEPDEESDTQPE